MRKGLSTIALAALTLIAASASAQPNDRITGTLSIDYQTRVRAGDDGTPEAGVKDAYDVNLNVGNKTLMHGSIQYTPTILSKIVGRETQQGQVYYNLAFEVMNPVNATEHRQVGKLVGAVPVDKNGVYLYDSGTLRVAIDAIGKIDAFESKFRGRAAGKPPRDDSALGRARKQALTVYKQVNGKTVALQVTDYDQMAMTNLVLAAGPTQGYPETTVNGDMIYDYDRDAWYFKNASMTYALDGKSTTDKLSGSIRWVESPNRAQNGEGQYEFDVRVNAPDAQKNSEAAAFASAGDESEFFAAPDTTAQSLTGVAKYKDTMSGEDVVSSRVAIDLSGNNLTQQQRLALTKLIWLVSVVPMNAE